MNLVYQEPIYALRSCFHTRMGDTDTKAAAKFFRVERRTIQKWIKTNSMPEWAKHLLEIKYRGYLPANGAWKDCYIHGERLYYNGYHGVRSVTPKQLILFELMRPPYSSNSGDATTDKFWREWSLQDKLHIKH